MHRIIKNDNLMIVVDVLQCNRVTEELVDKFWSPSNNFYTTYIIVDENDKVIKYRKDKRWHATASIMHVDCLIEHLMLIFG